MDNFRFKKKFGQNFLKNANIIKKIVDCGNVEPESLIFEVGTGSGNLTLVLADTYKDSKIITYEVDESLEVILNNRFKEYNNIIVKFGDFLKVDLDKEVSNYSYNKLYFISNVPYYITTPILFKLIDSSLSFDKIIMMVQKEVGDRFCSSVSKKTYGALTVILNYYFDIKKEFLVDRNQFVPKPNVDSVVVSFTKKAKLLPLYDEKVFIKLVHDSFKFKRKTIRNNLVNYNLDKVLEILNKYGFDLSVRAENLSYDIFVEISNNLV